MPSSDSSADDAKASPFELPDWNIKITPQMERYMQQGLEELHTRLRFRPVDYGRFPTSEVLDVDLADPGRDLDVSAISARGLRESQALASVSTAEDPLDGLLGGAAEARSAALSMTAVAAAELYVAAGQEVAASLLAESSSPGPIPFEERSGRAHDEADVYFTGASDDLEKRLQALHDPDASGTTETADDRRMSAQDQDLLAQLLEVEIWSLRHALSGTELSRVIDDVQVTLWRDVTDLSRKFISGLSELQQGRERTRRRRLRWRALFLAVLALLFVQFVVFADKAMGSMWTTEIVGSVLIAGVLWFVDRKREAQMNRQFLKWRHKLLADAVTSTTRYIVGLRMLQAAANAERALRGLPAEPLADWSSFT